MVTVFNSLFNYVLCFALSVGVVGLAVFLGTTLRKRKNEENTEV